MALDNLLHNSSTIKNYSTPLWTCHLSFLPVERFTHPHHIHGNDSWRDVLQSGMWEPPTWPHCGHSYPKLYLPE